MYRLKQIRGEAFGRAAAFLLIDVNIIVLPACRVFSFWDLRRSSMGFCFQTPAHESTSGLPPVLVIWNHVNLNIMAASGPVHHPLFSLL